MRSEADVITVRVNLVGSVELDWQRMVEDDPNWARVSTGWDLEDPLQLQAAIHSYLMHYIARERFLRDMPTTNGPGLLIPGSIQVQFYTEVQNGNDGAGTPGGQEGQG
jgi:hypothetical protein